MSVVRGFLAEIRPIPMTLLLLTVTLGGVFAKGLNVDWGNLALVLANAFCFLYVAHLWDTYNDYYRKNEYRTRKYHVEKITDKSEYLPRWGFGAEIKNAPILPAKTYLVATVITSAIGLTILFYLSLKIGIIYGVAAIGGLILALLYSTGGDEIPILGDTTWEIGVVLALWCGYISQKGYIDTTIMIMSIPLFLALVSAKALDSLPDTLVDNRRNKRTLTVLLYRRGLSLKTIRHLSFIPLYTALVIMFMLVPPNMKPVVILTAIAFLLIQIGLANDDGRKTIVAAGFILMGFITASILGVAGIL